MKPCYINFDMYAKIMIPYASAITGQYLPPPFYTETNSLSTCGIKSSVGFDIFMLPLDYAALMKTSGIPVSKQSIAHDLGIEPLLQ